MARYDGDVTGTWNRGGKGKAWLSFHCKEHGQLDMKEGKRIGTRSKLGKLLSSLIPEEDRRYSQDGQFYTVDTYAYARFVDTVSGIEAEGRCSLCGSRYGGTGGCWTIAGPDSGGFNSNWR